MKISLRILLPIIMLTCFCNVIYSSQEPLLGNVPIVDTKNNPNKINVLQYNIQLLGMPGKDTPGIKIRSGLIPDYIKDFDVIVFCEAFEKDGREELLAGMARNGFKYSSPILGAGIHQKSGKDQKRGKIYNQPSVIDLQSSNFTKGSSKYAYLGTRKFALTEMADAGLDIAEFGAKAVSKVAKTGAKAVNKIAHAFGAKKVNVGGNINIGVNVEKAEKEVEQIMHDGGVLIVSKYPIEITKEYIYADPTKGDINEKYLKVAHFDLKKALGDNVNWDWFANKGVLYAKIIKNDRPYHIFGTHTQALYRGSSDDTRRKLTNVIKSECDQMAQFIKDCKIPATDPVILAGDFNINQFKPNDEKYPNKDIFNHMQSSLNVVLPPLEGVQCVTGNSMNPKNISSSCEPSRIDYVMAAKDYAQVVSSFNKFVFMRTPKPWDKDGRSSLSDHEAMYGYFEFKPKQ